MKTVNSTLTNEELTKKELRDAFQCLQSNKSPGYYEISPNIMKNVFEEEICDPLWNISENSLTKDN